MKMQQKPVGSRGTVAAMIWSLEFRLRRSCRVDERGYSDSDSGLDR